MTAAQRLAAAFALQVPDRTPILGGWIACAAHIRALATASADEYAADPQAVTLRAYRRLGSDGLISLFIPRYQDEYRCVDHSTYQRADRGQSIDQMLAMIDELAAPEEVEAAFDLEEAYRPFRAELLAMQERCGEMVWMPAAWGFAAQLGNYGWLGYENWFLLFALDERRARKLLEHTSAAAYNRSLLLARAAREGLFPGAVLLGEDICDQRGPMIRMDFIERYYFPLLQRGLAPLRAAGLRPVWHSDGNVVPLVDLLLEAGICGFQGFQPECGMTLESLVTKRTRDGEPLLIFGPFAVTTELPRMTPDEVVARVRECEAICAGQASLVLFTSNTICPDVPLANVIAMHQAVGAWQA